jgi:serine/threonine-protein kinase
LTPRTLKYAQFEVEMAQDGFPLELGAGAMAITYRARDTILNSSVALKVIDRVVAENPAVRSRFLREARAAAQIHHPNVARVTQYGEQDGECFYAMELVEGETLEARVRRDGPLPLDCALEIIEQAARALVAAEKCGVVHRDIKPSNIMLESDPSGTLVKIIDYGIARVLPSEPERGAEQTQTGFIGTPAFASPEQFASSELGKIDTRSDIYSLGVTFWYLLSGRIPFVGSNLREVAEKQGEHLPLEQLKNVHIPARVIALLRSMLAFEPAKRPQTARELLAAIHRCHTKFSAEARSRRKRSALIAAAAALVIVVVALGAWRYEQSQSAAAVARSIAVLPFENLSPSPDDAYLAASIQDEILTKLASVGDLKVISRTSSGSYKSKPADLKTVGRQLGVAKILEGSVQRAADKVRVTVQLIDSRSDTHLWANTYDRDLKDVFAVESEISQTIANALQARLSPLEANRLSSAPTQDPEAYDLFLKGEYAQHEAENQSLAEPFDRAINAYQLALARDPNFSLAAARLVEAKLQRHQIVAQLSPAELDEVKALADHTLASAPNLPDAYHALALFYYFGKRRYDDALTQLQRALELEPNNVSALNLSAYIHRRQGQWKRALSEMESCEEHDPRNPELVENIAGTYYRLRMWKEAKRAALRALAMDPHNTGALEYAVLASFYETGNIEDAKRTLSDYPQPSAPDPHFSAFPNNPTPAYLKVLERDFTGALKLCGTEGHDPAEQRGQLASRAALHVLAGDAATAKDELERVRDLLEARLRERPDDTFSLLQLSWVNVALQRNADALRLAYQATELMPVEKDAIRGSDYLAALAEIQARTGATAEAVKTLRQLLAMPTFVISIEQLKSDPVWDPIRNDPGFKKLLAGKQLVGPNK